MLEVVETSDYVEDREQWLSSSKPGVAERISKNIETALCCIKNKTPMPRSFKDHPLKGKLKRYRDCHILPDLVMVYKVDKASNTVYLLTLSNHSQTFESYEEEEV